MTTGFATAFSEITLVLFTTLAPSGAVAYALMSLPIIRGRLSDDAHLGCARLGCGAARARGHLRDVLLFLYDAYDGRHQLLARSQLRAIAAASAESLARAAAVCGCGSQGFCPTRTQAVRAADGGARSPLPPTTTARPPPSLSLFRPFLHLSSALFAVFAALRPTPSSFASCCSIINATCVE